MSVCVLFCCRLLYCVSVLLQIEVLCVMLCCRLKYYVLYSVADWSIVCYILLQTEVLCALCQIEVLCVLAQFEVLHALFCFSLKYCVLCSVSDWSIVCSFLCQIEVLSVLFHIEVLRALFCLRLKYCLLCSVSGWSAHIVQLNRIQQMLGIYSSNCPCFLLPDSCLSVLCTSFTFVVDVCRTGYLNNIIGICCPTQSALIVNKQKCTHGKRQIPCISVL